MAIIVGVPRLSRRARLPGLVGLLLSGIVVGPHGLDVFGTIRPVADFFADLGKLLLMFCAGHGTGYWNSVSSPPGCRCCWAPASGYSSASSRWPRLYWVRCWPRTHSSRPPT